jgi:hypothetical protein
MTPGTMHPQCSRFDKSPMKALTGQFRPQASPDHSQGATNLKFRTPRLLQVFLEKVSYPALVIGTHLAVGKVVVEPKFSAAIVDQRLL